MVHPLKVSLEDLYLGTSKKLSLSRNVICSKCSGWVFSEFVWVLFYSSFLFGKVVCIGFRSMIFVSLDMIYLILLGG